MKKLIFLVIMVLPMLGSCKKEVGPATSAITPAEARDSLYYLMNDIYYWYKLMPVVNKDNYADPYTLMDAMIYKTLDRWSFVADYDAFNAEMQGSFVGHGIRIGLDQTNQARIAMIYNNSPLYAQGVRRGWIILKVNNTDLAPIMIAGNATAYNNLLGPATAGVTNTFLFQKPDGSQVTISSAKSSFNLNTVLVADTLQIRSQQTQQKVVTGHLVLESFIAPTESELATAFAYFKSVGAKDLILDMRYNLGGYLYVAQELASYIVGSKGIGANFANLVFNDKYQAYDQSFPFISMPSALDLSRIVVITTRLTVSAPEEVMNGIRPFVTLTSIGDTTDGKPVAMIPFPCGKKYYFSPVSSAATNNLGQGDFYKGFAPNKIAVDDITHDFSDRRETCLANAIQFLSSGNFLSGKALERTGGRRTVQYSERPAWMNNTFVKQK